MERLHISKNKRYFQRSDGRPFIWLADTVWTMPQGMKWDDVDYYMRKRKSQGFTVLQIVALDPERDVMMRNPAGVEALIDNDLRNPCEGYFNYLDWILKKAEEYEFYVLLLPVWGQLVVGDNWAGEIFEKLVTSSNAYEYGRWIGNRYRNYNHILWCLGGDRQPLHKGVDYRNVWRKMAEGLAKGITGKDLVYNKRDSLWETLLITYHTCYEMETGECSTMSYWDDEEAWISYIMLQSGHTLIPKNYELVKKEYEREIKMPVWDGEPAYEKMPTSWPGKVLHGSWIVRKRAYWSLFSGAFGYTYGHAHVWPVMNNMKASWLTALESEGSRQIKFMRDFLESKSICECIPCQEILQLQRKEPPEMIDEHVQACRHEKNQYICAYFPSGGTEVIETSFIAETQLYMTWFNPRDGICSKGQEINNSNKKVTVTTPTKGYEQDWILILAVAKKDLVVKPQIWGELKVIGEKRVFNW